MQANNIVCKIIDADSEEQIAIIPMIPGITLITMGLIIIVKGVHYQVDEVFLRLNDDGTIADYYAEVMLY